MKISCVIPTCDRPQLLIEAIDSVLSQTVPTDEIIVINNGGEKIFLPFETSNKVKIYNIIPYAGASQARNFGASLAKGNYVAFLDDDDLWNEKYIENSLAAIKQGADCVLSRIDIMDRGILRSCKNPHGKLTIKKLLVQNPGAGGPNIVISKKLFFKVGGYDVKLPTSEDKSLIIEVIKAGAKIITLPDNQVIARRDPKISRLTDAKTIAEGIYQFTRKYRSLMDKNEYLFNLLKIYKYHYQAGQKIAGIQYFVIKIIFTFLKILQK